MRQMQCILYNNNCYKAGRYITPTRIVVHSTGANNTSIKRYVQPHSTQTSGMEEYKPNRKTYNREQMIALLGKNSYGNDWNRGGLDVCVNAFIGKLADGSIAIVQTLPWKMRPWGVGRGPKGTFNDCAIQFEICEDNHGSESYCRATYKEAVELCAMLCKEYKISPDMIVSHNEAHDMGYGSNHGDPEHWWSKFGLSMSGFRSDVKKAMGASEPSIDKAPETNKVESDLKIGDEVRLISGAKYVSGKSVPSWVINSKLYVRDIRDNGNVVISTLKTGDVTGVVDRKYISADATTSSNSYKVRVTASALNIRSGPGVSYTVVGSIKDKGIYTIIEDKNGWGRLKSNAGWISLQYTKRV